MRIECITLESKETDTDLQYQYTSNKVDYAWFNARIRLAAKAMFKHGGLAELAPFWDLMLTAKFSIFEDNRRDQGRHEYTPIRCPFCGTPHPIGYKPSPLGYCAECDAMLDAMIHSEPWEHPGWEFGKS